MCVNEALCMHNGHQKITTLKTALYPVHTQTKAEFLRLSYNKYKACAEVSVCILFTIL